MALRPRGLRRPPSAIDPRVSAYLDEVKRAIEGLPFSYFSTANGPNESNVTSPQGTLGIEIGSSDTIFWIKDEDASASTGWKAVDYVQPYGALSHAFDNSAHTQSGITTVFQHYRGFDTEGVSSGITSSHTDDLFQVSETGAYEAAFSSSVTGDNNINFDFELFKNGADTGFGFTLATGSAGDVGNGALNSILTAASNDTLAVHVQSDSTTGAELTTISANFVLKKIARST